MILGVMQGRLLPKYHGRYQAHPVGYWQGEFALAAGLGLQLIEFILDYEETDKNPLMSSKGLDEIQRVSSETGVTVRTVCADYFMEAPFHSVDATVVERSQQTLDLLLENCARLQITDIVIPCVDQAAFNGLRSLNRFKENIGPCVELAERVGINLALETELGAEDFCRFLDSIDSSRVTANYDTGNSAYMGYDTREEFAAYGQRISDIHIKDRKRGGGPTMLGNGDVNFEVVFDELKKMQYDGPLVVQAWRDEEGVRVFRRQLEWLKPLDLDVG